MDFELIRFEDVNGKILWINKAAVDYVTESLFCDNRAKSVICMRNGDRIEVGQKIDVVINRIFHR